MFVSQRSVEGPAVSDEDTDKPYSDIEHLYKNVEGQCVFSPRSVGLAFLAGPVVMSLFCTFGDVTRPGVHGMLTEHQHFLRSGMHSHEVPLLPYLCVASSLGSLVQEPQLCKHCILSVLCCCCPPDSLESPAFPFHFQRFHPTCPLRFWQYLSPLRLHDSPPNDIFNLFPSYFPLSFLSVAFQID